MAYNKDQWISSFEDAILRLRPHMPRRVLDSIALMAWKRYGLRETDPQAAAEEWSRSMDGP